MEGFSHLFGMGVQVGLFALYSPTAIDYIYKDNDPKHRSECITDFFEENVVVCT